MKHKVYLRLMERHLSQRLDKWNIDADAAQQIVKFLFLLKNLWNKAMLPAALMTPPPTGHVPRDILLQPTSWKEATWHNTVRQRLIWFRQINKNNVICGLPDTKKFTSGSHFCEVNYYLCTNANYKHTISPQTANASPASLSNNCTVLSWK